LLNLWPNFLSLSQEVISFKRLCSRDILLRKNRTPSFDTVTINPKFSTLIKKIFIFGCQAYKNEPTKSTNVIWASKPVKSRYMSLASSGKQFSTRKINFEKICKNGGLIQYFLEIQLFNFIDFLDELGFFRRKTIFYEKKISVALPSGAISWVLNSNQKPLEPKNGLVSHEIFISRSEMLC
jgi:hypothetical protein